MSQQDLSQLDDAALRTRLAELRGQLAAELFRGAAQQGRRPAAGTAMRRDIARVLGLLSSRGVAGASNASDDSKVLEAFRRELAPSESSG